MVSLPKTIEEIKEAISTKSNIVILSSGLWCSSCRVVGPIFEKTSNVFDDIQFIKLDVDEIKESTNFLGLTSLPTFIYFKDGKEVARKSGAMGELAIKKTLHENFSI